MWYSSIGLSQILEYLDCIGATFRVPFTWRIDHGFFYLPGILISTGCTVHHGTALEHNDRTGSVSLTTSSIPGECPWMIEDHDFQQPVITQALLKWLNMIYWWLHELLPLYIWIWRERTQSMYTFLTLISLSVIMYIGRCFSCSSRQCHYESHVFEGLMVLTYTKSSVLCKVVLV